MNREKAKIENSKVPFERAVRELDDFFIRNNENGLYRFVINAVEKPLIESVLNKTDGNKLKAAKLLGINRNTLHSKIKRLGIEVAKWKKN
jgi:DNA-binding protein Fis